MKSTYVEDVESDVIRINSYSFSRSNFPSGHLKKIDFPHLFKANVSAKRQSMKASFDARPGPYKLPLNCSFRASLKRSFPAQHCS